MNPATGMLWPSASARSSSASLTFAGGEVLIALSTLAGAGYGLAYRVGGLQAAVLAHFGLLAHFTLSTYSMLAG